jgi:demethoxyubiquinone hydroxylase (CLK1/Coq7/Cat5 family)
MFAKDKIIERIVRVNQAGEIGAQRIYNGQKFVFKLFNNKKEYEIFSEMAQEEKEHLDFASEHDTGSDLLHNALKKGIKLLSKSAIKISEKA